MKIFPIKLKRRTVKILEIVSSIVAYALFAWIDRRLVVAMVMFEFSNLMWEYSGGITGGRENDNK